MVRKTENSESSDDEQRYSSSSEEWSEDSSEDVNEIVEVNGFQILDSQVIKHDIVQIKLLFQFECRKRF